MRTRRKKWCDSCGLVIRHGSFSSCHSYLECWCDWEELKREEALRGSPPYSCSTTGETQEHWKTPWKKHRGLQIQIKLLIHTEKPEVPCTPALPYPESVLRFPASESLCGWMRVWTALSKSFLQKQRWSWAIGSAGGRSSERKREE